MIDKYLQHLIGKINDRVLQLQETLSDDNAKDFGEYKKTCGEVKGLLTARLLINDLQQRLQDEDDE